tara:strand:+ start:46 stop:339 length:294 start_codon:yes stop_codon:yes gene_type:complete
MKHNSKPKTTQKKTKLSKEAKELNGKLLELSKTTKRRLKEVKNNDRIQFISPSASIYQSSATIIIKGSPITKKQKKMAKLIEFMSRAPISFDEKDES